MTRHVLTPAKKRAQARHRLEARRTSATPSLWQIAVALMALTVFFAALN